MNLQVRAMGQEVIGHLYVEETKVRVELMLPAIFSLLSGKIEGLLRSRGADMLEDKSKKG